MYLFLQVKLAWPVSWRARLGALKIIGLELSTTSCNNPQVLIKSQETWSTHSRHGYQGWLFLWQSLVIFEHPEHTRINHVFAFKIPKQLCCDKVICILSSEENWRDGHLWCVPFVPVSSPFRPDEKKADRYRTHWQKLSRIKKLPDFLKKNRQKLSCRLVRSQRKIKTSIDGVRVLQFSSFQSAYGRTTNALDFAPKAFQLSVAELSNPVSKISIDFFLIWL